MEDFADQSHGGTATVNSELAIELVNVSPDRGLRPASAYGDLPVGVTAAQMEQQSGVAQRELVSCAQRPGEIGLTHDLVPEP